MERKKAKQPRTRARGEMRRREPPSNTKKSTEKRRGQANEEDTGKRQRED